VLENKQSREIGDSALTMISMTYAPRGETIRFVLRNIRFASPVLGYIAVRNEMERVAVAELRASQIVGRSVLALKVRSLRSESRTGRHIAIRLKVAGRKKLRKRAAKPMKSLARVNLCASSLPTVSTSLGRSR
jgi:hypothetical protein